MYDDIPEARRQPTASSAPKPKARSHTSFPWRYIVAGVIGIVLLAGAGMLVRAIMASTSSPAKTPERVASDTPQTGDNILGHLAYEEATSGDLEPVYPESEFSLRPAAAQAYRDMENAAQADGVKLTILSAFRSKSDQNDLFFGIKKERNQGAQERAKVSAPPGHSEHHTGYALDLGDADQSGADLEAEFAQTKAYQWLEANAARYSFELSFPKDNPQGVSFEPWHWRFVGDQHSLETFYKARNLSKPPAQGN
jgi:zinc D-Ala-D-Ala carboxypeptidase